MRAGLRLATNLQVSMRRTPISVGKPYATRRDEPQRSDPLQGSSSSAPGFLPIVKYARLSATICVPNTRCPGDKGASMSTEKLSRLPPITVGLLVVGLSFQMLSFVHAAEPYTPPFAEGVRMSRVEWKKTRKPVVKSNPGSNAKPFSSLPMPHGPCF
jgi:hypothetical protein